MSADGTAPGLTGRLLAAARGRRLPFVLSYHGLGEETAAADPHGLMTTPTAFAEHLDLLLRIGYRLVALEELWTAAQRGGRAADGLGAITFDDGLAETLHIAGELLKPRGAVATAFYCPGLFGRDHPDLPPGRRIVRADEVPELERLGLRVGAHSYSHVDLTTLEPDAQREELVRSRGELEQLVGHPVTSMAYPYGVHDARTMDLAREAGYALACANDGAGAWRALALPREPVHPSTTPTRLRLKVAGVYGPVVRLRGHVPKRRHGAA